MMGARTQVICRRAWLGSASYAWYNSIAKLKIYTWLLSGAVTSINKDA